MSEARKALAELERERKQVRSALQGALSVVAYKAHSPEVQEIVEREIRAALAMLEPSREGAK